MSANPLNLKGMKFNMLTVIEQAGKYRYDYLWRCKCDCGNEIIARGTTLKQKGVPYSCGCHKIINLKGQKYGRLTVISFAYRKDKKTYWNCICDCGNECIVETSAMRTGHTNSCGCYMRERAKEANIKHGLYGTPLHKKYRGMIERCYDKNSDHFKYYGERGIIVCDEWRKDFKSFYDWAIKNGYEKHLTIDRIDNNGNYEPSNCRWVDIYVQANNKRNNRVITYNGKTQTLKQWCNELDLPYKQTHARIYKSKWSIEKAFSEIYRKEKICNE